MVCNRCLVDANKSIRLRYLRTNYKNGVYRAQIITIFGYISNYDYVYNSKYDYYVDPCDILGLSDTFKTRRLPSDIELRTLYPEKCDPYNFINSSLFDIMLRHFNT